MPEFNIPYGFQVLNPDQLDKRFGPYLSIGDALLQTEGLRVPGLKIGIVEGTEVVTYTVQANTTQLLKEGVSQEEKSRIDRMTSEQISKVESITTGDITKLKQDYTKAEIDQQFNDVRNFANSSRINLNGSTVLPVPPRRPDNTVIEDAWVRLAQNVTYTQAGGSPLTGIDGHETIAEWDNENGEWVLVDMGEMPTVTGTDVLDPNGEAIPKEKAVFDYINTSLDAGSLAVNYVNITSSVEIFPNQIKTADNGGATTFNPNTDLYKVPVTKGQKVRFVGNTGGSTAIPNFAVMWQFNTSDEAVGVVVSTDNVSTQVSDFKYRATEDGFVYINVRNDGTYPTEIYRTSSPVTAILTQDSSIVTDVEDLKADTESTDVISELGNRLTTESAVRGYASTPSEVDAKITSELRGVSSFNYSGNYPYRYYTSQTDYVDDSPLVSQSDDGDSDTVSLDATQAGDAVYYEIGIPILVSQNPVVLEAIINTSGTAEFGVGLGYKASNAVRGVMYQSVGRLARAVPFSTINEATGLTTYAAGDTIRIEATIASSTEQRWRLFKNGAEIYNGVLSLNLPVVNSEWALVLKGEVNATITKLYTTVDKFATKDYVDNAIANILHPTNPILQGFRVLPDRPTGAPSGGFTCTGLDRITRGEFAGCWLVGNDGRTVEGDDSPYTPEVLILDADFTRILKVIPMPYSGASLQGVAVDTSGSVDTFWVAAASNGTIRHFNMDGVEIEEDRFEWSTIYPSLGNPNGLAYDPINDAIWCCVSDSTGEARLISCNPALPNRELLAIVLTGTPDQLHLKGTNLYYTIGNNGVNGSVRVYDLNANEIADKYVSLPRAQAIEGLYIDDSQGMMYIANDGGYHFSAKPALNVILTYKV